MLDTACSKQELVDAFDQMREEITERKSTLWQAYNEATRSMNANEYDRYEPECWSILQAGVSGLTAEEQALRREFKRRMLVFAS